MTTRSQQKKYVEELVSEDLEPLIGGNNQTEILFAGTSKSKIQCEHLDEIKTSLRKEVLAYLTTILADNHKEMLMLVAPGGEKPTIPQNNEEPRSET